MSCFSVPLIVVYLSFAFTYFDLLFSLFFFFKQKTAYEMRISDWSSDVCSSDLLARRRRPGAAARIGRRAHRQRRRRPGGAGHRPRRSEEHTSELQSLMRISYAVFCLKKKKTKKTTINTLY